MEAYGCIRMHTDAYGCILDAYGCIRMHTDTYIYIYTSRLQHSREQDATSQTRDIQNAARRKPKLTDVNTQSTTKQKATHRNDDLEKSKSPKK